MSASIFSLSCDLDWNSVRQRVIPSPQLWGPSVARGASVFCHFSSPSAAEKENGAKSGFSEPHLSSSTSFNRGVLRGITLTDAAPCPPRWGLPSARLHGEGMLRRRLLRSPLGFWKPRAQLTQPHHAKTLHTQPQTAARSASNG